MFLFFTSNKSMLAINLSRELDVSYMIALLTKKYKILMISSSSNIVFDSIFYGADAYIILILNAKNCTE